MIAQNKIVIFGAGKIGRSFIGQLFSQAGFEVVFVDINKQIVEELNRRKSYEVVIKSEKDEVIQINNIRGIDIANDSEVVDELATARIAAISVGQAGQKTAFPLIAKALQKRHKVEGGYPLDLIIAENQRNADEYFSRQLSELLPSVFPLKSMIGLIETSIGKMVPIMPLSESENDILKVYAEPYNTLILNKKAFLNPIPEVPGLAPKENIKAWVDRKLFIHNLGHATAAYIGYLKHPERIYLWQVLSDEEVMTKTKAAMNEAAEILLKIYPNDFTPEGLTEHIGDLLNRFQNRSLGDTVYRVGCDLLRKLGPDDRLSGAIRAAVDLSMPFDNILFALVAACHFLATDENGKRLKDDEEFTKIYEKGIDNVLKDICGFDPVRDKIIFEKSGDLILKTFKQ